MMKFNTGCKIISLWIIKFKTWFIHQTQQDKMKLLLFIQMKENLCIKTLKVNLTLSLSLGCFRFNHKDLCSEKLLLASSGRFISSTTMCMHGWMASGSMMLLVIWYMRVHTRMHSIILKTNNKRSCYKKANKLLDSSLEVMKIVHGTMTFSL